MSFRTLHQKQLRFFASLSLLNILMMACAVHAAAQTTIFAAALGFGNVAVNQSSAIRSITLKNTQSTVLSIQSLTVPSGYAIDPSTTCGNPGTLAAGKSCVIALTLTPPAPGAMAAGNLTITTNAANSPQTVALSGTGVEPATLSASALAFGNVVLGESSAAKSLTLMNNQLTALHVQSIAVPSGYALTSATTCGNPGTLAAGKSCVIAITLTPAALGAMAAGNLTITSDAANSPQNVSLTGTGITETSLTPAALNFGDVQSSTSSAVKLLALKNNQDVVLTITSVVFSGPFSLDTGAATTCPLAGGNVSGALAAGASCVMGVHFQPTSNGAASGQITVLDSASHGPVQASLSGTGVPAAALSASTLGFGNVVINTASAVRTVRLTNYQTSSLTLSSITVGLPFALDPTTTTCSTAAAVAGGSFCTIGVSFTPAALGAATPGTLTVQNNASGGTQTLTASLIGTGVPAVALSPTGLAFGTVVVAEPVTKSLTIRNNQATPLHISAINGVTGALSLASATTCPTVGVLNGASSCVLAVTLNASALGAQSGSITISDDAPGGSQTIAISGIAIAPVTLAPARFIFPAQFEGTTSKASIIKLTNVQNLPLTIASASLSGVNSGDFTVSSLCPTAPATLPAGSSCTFSVQFTPVGAGTRSATLTITDDASGSPQTVALSGTGVEPLIVTPASITTYSGAVGASSAYKTITILNNTTTDTYHISGLPVTGDFVVTATTCGATSATPPPYTLKPGASCKLTVNFAPTIGGTRSGQLQVIDDAATSPQVVNLSGTGTTPLSLTPSALIFSAQKLGTLSPPKNLTLINHESQPESFTLATAGNFTATSNCMGGVIAANSQCVISVVFAPALNATPGPLEGSLTLADSAHNGAPFTVSLSGSATSSNPPPAVTTVEPGAGAAGSMVNVLITGNGWTHFSSSSAILFVDSNNGNYASDITVTGITVLSANQISAKLQLTGGTGVIYGARNIFVKTPLSGGGTEMAELAQAFTIGDPTQAHTISTIAPNYGTQGETLNVSFTASGTHFVQGTTFVNFGAGITVNSLTILDPTDAIANITISNTTTTGYRTITMMTGGEYATSSAQGFQVGPNSAALQGITPNSAGQGTSLAVQIAATGTHFLPGATQVAIGGGVMTGAVTVSDASHLTAQLAVPSTGAIGVQNVTVSTGGEIATLPNAFTILGTTPYLASISPSSGSQGQTLNVEIQGVHTNFDQSAILADFTGEIQVNSITVNSPVDVVVNLTISQYANAGSITARLTSGPAGAATIFPFTFTVTASAAQIVSVTPASVAQGAQVTLSVVGSGTSWAQATTQAAFYPQLVPTPSVQMITVSDSTDARLNITVPGNTPPGNYPFYMQTGGQVVSASIRVYAQTPTLTMNPANAMPGTQFSVSFTGQFTHFVAGKTQLVIAGEGVTPSNFTVTSPVSATATLAIASWAQPGMYLVTMTTGSEIVTTSFAVNYASIYDVEPRHAAQNTTLDVSIVGSNSHFTAGSTNVLFGPQITVNKVTVADSTHLIANITTSYQYNGQSTATPPGFQLIYVNTGSEQLLAGFRVDPPASPALVSVVPSSAAQGSTIQVTITGSLTNWSQSETEAILGAGVTISNLVVTSPTTATATIAVSPTAPLGGNTVVMYTGSEVVSGTDFSVTPGAASIYSVEPPIPNCDPNGQFAAWCPGSASIRPATWVVSQLQTITLNLVGVGTHWLQGETAITFQTPDGNPDGGIHVDALTVTSPTTAQMQITVLSSAPIGFTSLTTITDGEVVTMQQAIDVEENFPALVGFTPNMGEQAGSYTIQILGRATHWNQGSTVLSFNQDITVNSVSVIDNANLTANITVSPWAWIDYFAPMYCGHVLMVTTGTEQVSSAALNDDNFCVTAGAAQINSVAPLSGAQGSTETVTITGSDTHFVAGVTTVGFGDPNFQSGQITVNSPTSLSLPVGISTAAASGFKTVTVSTYGEVAQQQYSFIVNPGVGTLNEAIPNQAEQGTQSLDVQIIGQYTHFSPDSTVTFGAGITVNSISWKSTTQLTANINIDPISYPGGRTVTVTTPNVDCGLLANTANACAPGAATGSEIVANSVFSITPGPAIISGVAPGTGNQGQEVVFTISGSNTHWQQNFTQFYIPGGGSDITINSVVVNSATSATVDISIGTTAAPGARSIFMVTAGESLVDSGGFVITGGIPVITWLTPNYANPGASQLEVDIHGLFTQWDATSTVSFGPGITVTSKQVDDNTHIEAVINVDAAAQPGYHTVAVQTGTQILTSNFLVKVPAPPPTPYISYFWPSQGLPGQTFTISITGQNTHWDPGPINTPTSITFGDGISVNTFQVTSPTTALANISIGAAASAGERLVVMTTGSEAEQTGFYVQEIAQSGSSGGVWPTLSIVDPGSAMQGTQNLTVNIMGQYTTFDETTTFSFGPGITVNGPPTILGPTIATQSISIGQEAATGGYAVTATTAGQSIGGAGFTVTPSLAGVLAVTPNTALQGNALTVEITGVYTHWDGSTTFSFGAGIVVTSTVVNSNTDATVSIVIPPLAAEGATWVTARTAGEVATLANAFVVQPGTPLLLSSGPGSLPQQSSAVFTILSQATQWTAANPPTVSFGDGVTLTNVNVTSATAMTVSGYIQPTTQTGWRNLTVSTPTQVLSLGNALYVTSGPAAINSIAPNTGGQGAALVTVILTGVNTHWQQGVTTLSFPYVLVNSFVVNSPTQITANIVVNQSAPAGQVSITATTGGEVATIANGFTISQTQPELLAIVSSSGFQGQTETVTLTGFNTHFSSASVVSFGVNSGITVNAVNAVSSSSLQANITVQPTTQTGARAVIVTTGSESVQLNNAFQVTVGQAGIAALLPSGGAQNATASVQITGSQTNFASGVTTASFGGGILVSGITVQDALHATVAINIPASTAVGQYNVILTTGGETATILGGFAVTPGTPVLSGVGTPNGHQGDQNLSVALTGLFTHFVNGVSTANFGAGITVNSLTVTDATDAVAAITISATAAQGSRTVAVTTGAEYAAMVGGFTVLAGTPALVSVTPATGTAGSTMNVTVSGAFTSFQQGFSNVSFGSGITVNAVTVNSQTQLNANISIVSGASIGNRDVSVTTNSQTVTLSGAFNVLPGTPVVTVINPNVGVPNSTVTVTITGQYTNWSSGATVVSFGSGITVGAGVEGAAGTVSVNSATSLTATLNIDPNASLGPRDVSITTGTEVETVSGGFTVQPQTISPPTLISLSPGISSGGLPINGNVFAVFSQPMDRTTINSNTVILYLTSNPNQGWVQTPGTVTLDATGRVLSFSPLANLAVNSTYDFRLSNGIQDASGNTFNGYDATLYTTSTANVTPPTVVAFNPPALSAVGTNVPVQLAFSTDMNQTTQAGFSITANGAPVAGTLSWNSAPYCNCGSGTVLSFTPTAPLQPNTTYTVSYGAPLADMAGNGLTPGSFTFNTGSGADTANNSASLDFTSGQSNLPTNAVLRVNFSKPVNPINVNTGSLYLYNADSGKYVKGTVTVAADGMSATFTPNVALLPDTYYDLHMSWGGTSYDADGNYLNGVDGAFTTGAAQNQAAPTATLVSPLAGSTAVPLNTQIVAQFSAPVDPETAVASIQVIPQGGSAIAGSASLASDQVTLSFTPASSLAPNTQFTVQISGFQNMAGNAGTPYSVNFTTINSVAPITVSTGLDAGGNVLSSGDTPDAHWSVIPSGSATAQPLLVVTPGQSGWYGGWPGNGPDSSWININPDSPYGNTYGVYSTSFNLSGYDLSNLCLVGAMGVDDNGELAVNGNAIMSMVSSINSLTPLNLKIPASSLKNGTNTLSLIWGATDNYDEAFRLQGSIQTCGAILNTGLAVASVTPASGSTNVPTNSSITITFNNPLNPATVNASTLPVMIGWNGNAGIAGNYQVSGNTVTFTPDSPFPVSTTITLGNCNGPQDMAGETISGCYWYQLDSFTTAATAAPVTPATPPFQVTAFTPANGASGVGLRSPVVATFNRSFNPNTINQSAASEDFMLFNGDSPWCGSYARSQDNATLWFTCLPLPASSPLTAEMNSNLQDFAGNSLVNFTSQFTTMAWDSGSSGSIISVRPGAGASGVDPSQPLVLFTNLPINAGSAGAGLQVAQNNVLLPGSTQVLDNGYTLEFTPATPLTPGALIQWWSNSSLLDATNGNSFNANSGYFYVAADTSTLAPTVQAISPSDGSQAAPNSIFDVQFNTPLDPSTVNSTNIYLYEYYTGLNVAGTYSMPQPNVVRIVPSGNLASVDYFLLYVTNGLTSATGVPANPVSWLQENFYTGIPVDSTLPTLSSAVPFAGATNVGVNVSPGVIFSKAIDPVSVNSQTFQVTQGGVALAGNYWFSSDDKRVEFVPYAPLPASASLTMTLHGVLDRVGNPVNYSSTFTTGAGPDFTTPTIVTTSVSNNAVVPVNSAITVQFSESMDVSSFTYGNYVYIQDSVTSTTLSATLSWSADQSIAYIVPASPLAAGRTYYLYVGYGTDLAGNQLGWYEFPFHAQLSESSNAPTVIQFNPVDREGHPGINAIIEAQFSAPIDPTTIGNVTLASGGVVIAATPVISAGNTVLQLLPATPLLANTTYTMTIAGVKDPAGNSVATASNSFTTGATFDLGLPVLASYNPPNNSTVGINIQPQLLFSKPLNPITVNNSSFQMYLNDTGQWIPLTVTAGADGKTVTLAPQIALLPETHYYIQSYGCQDQNGNNCGYIRIDFNTSNGVLTAGPAISISPADGSTGVPLNATVIVNSNEVIDPLSWSQNSILVTDSSGNPVAGSVSLTNSSTLSFQLASGTALNAAGNYTVSVSGFADATGNAVTPATAHFTTGASAGSGGLYVVSSNISWGATNVPNHQPITLVFSQPLDAATVNSSTLEVMNGWNSNMGIAGSYTVSGNAVTFTPSQPYPAGANIYMGECGGPTDQLGEVFGNGSCWFQALVDFTVSSAAPDTSPLQVVAVSPANGAANVRHDQPVSVTFNKSINPYSVWNQSGYFAQLYAGENPVNNGSFSVSADGLTLSFNNGALNDGTTYTVVLPASGITDQSGNGLATTFRSSFTTAVNPATGSGNVASVRPSWNASGVATDSLLTLFTDRAVNAATLPGNLTVTVNGQIVSGTVQAVSGNEIQFTPATAFPNSALVQWFFSGVLDASGNAFNSNSGVFHTAAAPPDPGTAQPQIVAVSPALWTSHVATNAEIDIEFSQPIDASTLNGNIWQSAGQAVGYSMALATPTTVRISPPPGGWNPATSYGFCNNGSVKGVNGVNTPYSCWMIYFTTAAAPDTTPGTVSLGPPDGSGNVGTNAYIRLQFSKPVDVTTLNSGTVQISANGNPVSGSWTWNYSGNDATGASYWPDNPLPASTAISVATNGLLDYAGNVFKPRSAQFTTAAGPDFTTPSVSLDFGWNASGISTRASFTCRYSEPIDPGSVTPAGTSVWSYVDNTIAPVIYTFSSDLMSVTMTPTTQLYANSEYNYSCNSAIDLTGNSQNNNWVYFYTGNGPTSSGPVLLQSNPPNGFTNAPPNDAGGPWYSSNLGLLFNEPVAEDSLSQITLTPKGGAPIPISVYPVNGDTMAVLVLPYPLQPNTTYTYNVTGVADYSGNPITPVTSSFTTGGNYDWTRPSVAAFSPADQSQNVDVNSPITITFSKAMNPVLLASNQVFLEEANTGAVVPATLSFSPDYTTVTLTPATALSAATRYTMLVNGSWITDIAGNTINTGQVTATFTTGTPAPVDGVCGSASGGSFLTAPPAGALCAAGSASAITNPGAWSWSCNGQYGGQTASCSAQVSTVGAPACNPQQIGLAGWWPGNDNANDLIGGNNGTLMNGVGYALGEVGDAFSLNGQDQYVLIGQPVPANLQIQNAITLSAWIYPTAYPLNLGSGPYGMIVGSQMDENYSGAALFFNAQQDNGGSNGVPVGSIIFSLGDGGAFYQVATQSQVALNQWTLITATATANKTPQIYFNGVLQPAAYTVSGSGTTWNGTIAYPDSDWFAIGQEVNENRPFTGQIDEVQIYNTALTAAQVQALYNSAATGTCAVQNASTVTLSSSQSPADQGTQISLTAAISPSSATGTITFYDGGVAISGPISVSGGQAVLNTATLAFGSHSITALYSGDNNNTSSISTALIEQITLSGRACAPQPAGLISWWKGDGDGSDQNGINPLILYNSATFAAGEAGEAFSFPGFNYSGSGYARNSNTQSIPVSGPVSFAAWLQYDSTATAGNNPEVITLDGPSACNGNGILHGIVLGGKSSVAIARGCNQTPSFSCSANINIGDKQWHHVATTWDGSNSTVYIDGAQQAQCAGTDFTRDTSWVSVGGRPDQDYGNSVYTGLADEVQIYDRALNSGEVAQIYAAGGNGVCGVAN